MARKISSSQGRGVAKNGVPEATAPENRFELFADVDLDGVAMMIGLHHAMIGPPRPGFLLNTGAIEVNFNVHHTDIDTMIDALKDVRKALRKAGV